MSPGINLHFNKHLTTKYTIDQNKISAVNRQTVQRHQLEEDPHVNLEMIANFYWITQIFHYRSMKKLRKTQINPRKISGKTRKDTNTTPKQKWSRIPLPALEISVGP
jgi:hypothetical protein